jgi:hypothetical protein
VQVTPTTKRFSGKFACNKATNDKRTSAKSYKKTTTEMSSFQKLHVQQLTKRNSDKRKKKRINRNNNQPYSSDSEVTEATTNRTVQQQPKEATTNRTERSNNQPYSANRSNNQPYSSGST